jgi:hypothetical protein
MGTVHPVDRSGAWELETSYRARAELCATLLKTARERSRSIEAQRSGTKVANELWASLQEVALLADAQIVFSAMAVESFLNFYGVRRLGEDFYTANYERLSSQGKVSSLIGLCTGHLLDDKDELMAVTRRITARRNALVHPKTKEARPGRKLPLAEPRYQLATAAIEDMRRFFALYTSRDPGARGSEHTG